jgi:hypothetical protein
VSQLEMDVARSTESLVRTASIHDVRTQAGGNRILRNVGILLHHYMVSQLKIEAAGSTETSVSYHIITKRHVTENLALNLHCRGNLKSYICNFTFTVQLRETISVSGSRDGDKMDKTLLSCCFSCDETWN